MSGVAGKENAFDAKAWKQEAMEACREFRHSIATFGEAGEDGESASFEELGEAYLHISRLANSIGESRDKLQRGLRDSMTSAPNHASSKKGHKSRPKPERISH
jgi:hypothetical protein